MLLDMTLLSTSCRSNNIFREMGERERERERENECTREIQPWLSLSI